MCLDSAYWWNYTFLSSIAYLQFSTYRIYCRYLLWCNFWQNKLTHLQTCKHVVLCFHFLLPSHNALWQSCNGRCDIQICLCLENETFLDIWLWQTGFKTFERDQLNWDQMNRSIWQRFRLNRMWKSSEKQDIWPSFLLAKLSEHFCESMFSEVDSAFLLYLGICEENA